MDNIEGMLWLATQTLNILCYSPQSNARRIAPENVVYVVGINELKSSFCIILSHCFSYAKTIIHLSVGDFQWMSISPLHGLVNIQF